MKKTLILLFVLAATSKLRAHEIHYEVSDQTAAAPMLRFSIPYTLGTHDGAVHSLSGFAQVTENDQVVSARFEVPIDSMKTGHDLRDCHMREALGIEYSDSRFPREHVCDGNNQIPQSGPDSIQYPVITVEFVGMTLPSEPFVIGSPQNFKVKGKIKIHGIVQEQVWPVLITKTVNANGIQGFRLVTRFPISLRSFNIKVKPFMGIGVKDTATVSADIALVRK